jgi:hypothetical protein
VWEKIRETPASMFPAILIYKIGNLTTVRAEVPAVKSAERVVTCLVLRPPKLPIDVQHRILLVVQQILEESCFKFMKECIPSLLKERG